MAGVAKINGNYGPIETISRDMFFKVVGIAGAAAMTQADLNRIMQELHLTVTIEVIGAFVDGTSTSVNVMISGADVTAFAGGTDTIGDLADW